MWKEGGLAAAVGAVESDPPVRRSKGEGSRRAALRMAGRVGKGHVLQGENRAFQTPRRISGKKIHEHKCRPWRPATIATKTASLRGAALKRTTDT